MQYVAVRLPPGPRSAGFNPAAAAGRYDQGQPAVSDSARSLLAEVIRVIWEFPFPAYAIPSTRGGPNDPGLLKVMKIAHRCRKNGLLSQLNLS